MTRRTEEKAYWEKDSLTILARKVRANAKAAGYSDDPRLWTSAAMLIQIKLQFPDEYRIIYLRPEQMALCTPPKKTPVATPTTRTTMSGSVNPGMGR